jgi:CubicO group peptidase (beta-lactamase class C family)
MGAAPPAWQECIAYANAHEVAWPRDPHADPAHWGIHHDDKPPWNRLRGPVHSRGGVSGVVLQHGSEIVAWGEPDRADLTFSVAKTYLALLAGVAHTRGLLPDPDEPVVRRVPGIGFDSAHNRVITWTHLLEQSSEWEGECFGLPDTVDRYRKVSHDPRPQLGRKGDARPLQAPGTYWEYNDVRINQLALALLHLFGKPLPEVFGAALMQPLGGSDSWRWTGYDDAWIVLAGQRMQSVPGGSHWGAGVSISARDQARIGQLMLAGGRHGQQQLIAREWIERMQSPCAMAPFYGWLTWINSQSSSQSGSQERAQRHSFPHASARSHFMFGAGGHYVWMEPEHDAVVVVRWLDSACVDRFMELASKALEATAN